MRFNSALLAALAAPLLVLAQSNSTEDSQPNPFIWGQGGIAPAAGQSTELSWTPTTDGTVTLILRSGASNNLNEGAVIASNIPNSGSYTWDVDSDITRGSDYTVEIVDDDDSSNVNYSPYFVVESDNTVASSTGEVTVGAPTASSAITASMATTTGSASDASVTGSSTTSDASGSTATATESSASGSATGSSATSTVTSTGSSSESATSASATQSDVVFSSSSEAAGSRATAMAGMLGVVALGALAL